MLAPTIIVYAGRGSSHSWTWLADLFESNGISRVRFLDSREFISSLSRDGVNTAVISGGDGFTIADALKGSGFKELEAFIRGGGAYFGICAGAYLPLPSSVEPFSEFNLSTTKIANIGSRNGGRNSLDPWKEIPYGTCSILHPVRGPVHVVDDGGGSVIAPLYGGPVFAEPIRDAVLMRYKSFTAGTELQFDEEIAAKMVIGKPAALKAPCGEGRMVLLGPHLEHPRYAPANALFLKLMGCESSAVRRPAPIAVPGKEPGAELARSISDLKVAILGLENRSFTVGHKAWDGSRLLEIVSAIEKRQYTLADDGLDPLVSSLDLVRAQLLAMTVGTDSDPNEATSLLIDAARMTVDHHFAVIAEREARATRGIT